MLNLFSGLFVEFVCFLKIFVSYVCFLGFLCLFVLFICDGLFGVFFGRKLFVLLADALWGCQDISWGI